MPTRQRIVSFIGTFDDNNITSAHDLEIPTLDSLEVEICRGLPLPQCSSGL
jgi:hypothetical protein